MIEFTHISKYYPCSHQYGDSLRTALAFRKLPLTPSFTALDDVSFNVSPGEALGIVGGNGAGKSTLLKVLTRVTRPSAGQVRVRGRISSLLEVGAGFHRDLSGKENICLAGAILGMSPGQVRARMDEIVMFSGLEAFLSAPVRTYSSGMYLRLAFSIGVHLDADILVIDEALAVGDRNFQTQCLEKIGAFRRQGGTLVLVSHDNHQLRNVCERGLLLDAGRIVCDSDINTVLTHYTTFSKYKEGDH